MESVVLVALEEVRVAIGVLQRCVQVVGNTLPVGDGLGIASLDRRPLGRIEAPELAALEEVYLAIAPPNHCGVQMVGNAREALADFLRVDAVHLTALVAPVLSTLEEVRLAVLVGERRIDVARQSRPALGDELWVALLHGVRGQLVVLVALEGVGLALRRVEECVYLGVLADGVV